MQRGKQIFLAQVWQSGSTSVNGLKFFHRLSFYLKAAAQIFLSHYRDKQVLIFFTVEGWCSLMQTLIICRFCRRVEGANLLVIL